MENVITLNNDLIEVSLAGRQSYQAIESLISQSIPLILKLKAQGRMVRILVDISNVTQVETKSNQISLLGLELTPFNRMAVVGGNNKIKAIVENIILASGKWDRAKVFGKKDEALAWLLET